MNRRRSAVGALGIALSAAAVILLLRQVSAKDLIQNIRHANGGWLLAGCLVTVVVYWLRARRWGEILSPEAHVRPGVLFRATMVGFLAINTLPARLGELVRAYALARAERLRTVMVLGSVAIERIFDLAALAGFWALSLLFAPYPAWFRWSGYLTIGISALVTVLLWFLHARHYGTIRSTGLRRFVPAGLIARLEHPVASFTAGLQVFGEPRTLLNAGILTAAMWLVNGSVFLLVGESIGLKLPIWSPFLLSFVVCVAIMVPSSPGFIGVLEGSCVVGLSLVGVEASRALAFGVLYHLTQILPVLLLGGAYAIRGRIGWTIAESGAVGPEGGSKRKN